MFLCLMQSCSKQREGVYENKSRAIKKSRKQEENAPGAEALYSKAAGRRDLGSKSPIPN